MRIIFVYKWGFSFGVAYLASYLKERGHEVDLVFKFDTFSNSFVNLPFLEQMEDAVEDVLNNILKKKPDIVAFSVSTADYQWALDTASKVKSRSNVSVIFGGIHPTLLPEMTINNKQVDMICIGEGELALAELLDSLGKGKIDYSIKNLWFKKNGEIVRNALRPLNEDLDNLPLPDRDLFFKYYPAFWKKEIGFILASRGCPFTCSYCCNNAYNNLYRNKGKIIRLRSAQNVIAECNILKEEYTVKKIHFQDDLFASNTSWLEEFIPLYKKQINLPFSCLSHPKTMSERNIRLLKEGGCHLVIVGVQSGSERVRREIYHRRETNGDIANFSKICHKVGLNFSFNHIFDAPTETEGEIIETAKFYNSLRPKIIDSYVLVYFPCAEVIKTAVQEGILSQDDVNEINAGRFEGQFQGGFYRIFAKNYKKYSMLYVLIPLLPRKVMDYILRNKQLINIISKIPIKLTALLKLIENFRCGTASFHFAFLRITFYRMLIVPFGYWQLRNRIKNKTGEVS